MNHIKILRIFISLILILYSFNLKSMIINIGLCTDEHYAMPCGICITSIFENNKNNSVCIHLICENLEEKTSERYMELAKKYKQQIKIYPVDSSMFNDLPISNRYKKSIYFRLLFPSILSTDITTLLYLDSDIIVLKDLSALMQTPLNSSACGVVEDQFSDDIRNKNRINKYDTYFNTGVLLINLEVWRKQDITAKCIQFMHLHPELSVFPDQDALNIVLDNNIVWLDSIYNYQEGLFCEKGELMLHKDKWHKVDRSIEDIAILHYTFSIKPWHKECQHPYKSLFLNFKNKSVWKSTSIEFWNKNFVSKCRYYYERFKR